MNIGIPPSAMTKDEHDALAATRTRPVTQDPIQLRAPTSRHQVEHAVHIGRTAGKVPASNSVRQRRARVKRREGGSQ